MLIVIFRREYAFYSKEAPANLGDFDNQITIPIVVTFCSNVADK